MFSLQRKLKNSVCNYILKYVADNNDQSRDQGVSKFVGTKASQSPLWLEGNVDTICPKAFADEEVLSPWVSVLPSVLPVRHQNTRLLTSQTPPHTPSPPSTTLLPVRDWKEKMSLKAELRKAKRIWRNEKTGKRIAGETESQMKNEAFVLCAGRPLEVVGVRNPVIEVIFQE